MAVLAPPFVLCPFTEGKELLGFSKDQAENKIIFTLGKNIAIRYSVKEQKQEISWTLKIHWFTSKVVFCSDLTKYGAVINNNVVCLWNEEDTSLIACQKYKCSKDILEIIPTTTFGTLVVFKNGVVTRLAELTQQRKYNVPNGPINENKSIIFEAHVDEVKNLLFVISGPVESEEPRTKIGVEKKRALCVHVINIPTAVTLAAGVPSLINEVNISVDEEGRKIIGSCILSDSNADPCILYLVSDGKFFKKNLMSKGKDKMQTKYPEEDTAVEQVCRFSKFISTDNPVVIKPCAGSTTIVVYGCNPSEEGSVVLLYDLTYDLILSNQSLKLYSSPPIMTKIDQNIFVPLGLNILVVGIRPTQSLLSNVMGQHSIQGIDFVEVREPWQKGWEEQERKNEPEAKQIIIDNLDESSYEGIDLQDLEEIVRTLESNGHPESLVCTQVVLQALEKSNSWRDALRWILAYFEYIPEDILVTMLLATLNGNKMRKTVVSTDNVDNFAKNESLLGDILNRNFDRIQMVRSLRTMDYNVAKILLERLNESMDRPFFDLDQDGNICNETYDSVYKAMNWAGVLLDAHYKHFVFHNETALCDELLKRLEEKMIIMKEIEQIEPLVRIIQSKTRYEPLPNPNSVYRVVNVVFR